jgi:HSP20 family protein
VRPLVDVSEVGGLYVIEVELPGVLKGDISVRIEDGSCVCVEGVATGKLERENAQAIVAEANAETGADARLLVAERTLARGAKFARTVRLPGKIEKEGSVAEMRVGLLTIKVVKAEVEARIVEIA